MQVNNFGYFKDNSGFRGSGFSGSRHSRPGGLL